MPGGRLPAFKLTVTELPAPAASAPPPETLSQDEVLTSDHVSEEAPALVTKKVCEVTLNGPPNAPTALNPPLETTTSGSGLTMALIKVAPAGVPKPVQRS